jgi:hypothetical protein
MAPIVDFPEPETPMMITTAGAIGATACGGCMSIDVISPFLSLLQE